MITFAMDHKFLTLLREVRGDRILLPIDETEAAKRDFARKVRMLKELRIMRYIDFHEAHAVPDNTVDFESYHAVGPVYLTNLGVREIEVALLIEPVGELKDKLEELSLDMCVADFGRALDTLVSDPAQSLANASSCFESIAKAILDYFNAPYPKDQSIQSLFASALKCLKLNPADATLPEIKRLCGGLLNVASAVGVLRTQNSAAHGKSERQQVASTGEARLAINALATVGIYLLEIAKEQQHSDDDI